MGRGFPRWARLPGRKRRGIASNETKADTLTVHNGARSHEERVTGLEVWVGNIDDKLTVFERKLDTQFESTRTALLALNERFSETRRTSWGVLAGWAAVVVSLVGIVGASYLRDLDRVLEQTEKQSDAFLAHVRDGHPYRVEDKIAGLRSEIEKVRELEGRQLDTRFANVGTEVHRLDERIDEAIALRIAALERRVEALEAFRMATALSRFTKDDGQALRDYVEWRLALVASGERPSSPPRP